MSNIGRRKSRILAVQLAYGCELSENSAENLLESCFFDENIQKESIIKDLETKKKKILSKKEQTTNIADKKKINQKYKNTNKELKINKTYLKNLQICQKYSLKLVNLIQINLKNIDYIIENNSKNWDIKRIALTDKIILRLAINEMLYVDNVPEKVSISEAVEISKIFGTKESGPFVNGILDAIYKKIKTKKLF